ncbi:MAG: SsrA-binding protein SmpB [bacterium]
MADHSHTYARNRKAGFDIEVQEKYEAGIVLTGDEIKSIRSGRMQLSGSYVKLMRGHSKQGGLPEVVLIGMNLSQAAKPDRTRRLLLHAREVETLTRALEAKGKVAVPLSLYFKRGWAKVSVGVGVGRRQYDKRELLRKREGERSQERELKGIRRP